MPSKVLAELGDHKNILLEDGAIGAAIQANQHLIIHGNEGVLLDPGGSKTFRRAYPEALGLLGRSKLKHIILSHQDPDIVAAVNGWLGATNATAHVSKLWVRFVAHFGLDRLATESMNALPDEGAVLEFGGAEVWVLPAHFLHSVGNFQVYDPTTKVLYTGDLGASVGHGYQEVPDFDAHLQHMQPFHERYMVSNKVMRMWAEMARGLDIDLIAPQHGAYFKGKEMVTRFIDWAAGLQCGTDLIDRFQLPPGARR